MCSHFSNRFVNVILNLIRFYSIELQCSLSVLFYLFRSFPFCYIYKFVVIITIIWLCWSIKNIAASNWWVCVRCSTAALWIHRQSVSVCVFSSVWEMASPVYDSGVVNCALWAKRWLWHSEMKNKNIHELNNFTCKCFRYHQMCLTSQSERQML